MNKILGVLFVLLSFYAYGQQFISCQNANGQVITIASQYCPSGFVRIF